MSDCIDEVARQCACELAGAGRWRCLSPDVLGKGHLGGVNLCLSIKPEDTGQQESQISAKKRLLTMINHDAGALRSACAVHRWRQAQISNHWCLQAYTFMIRN